MTDRPTTETVYTGKPVVPGVAFGPAAWVTERPPLPEPGEMVPEDRREAEFEAFTRAVDVVCSRLEERAAAAQGHAAEVLTATVTIARDRAWARKVRTSVRGGQTNLYAVRQATDDFVELFLKAGGVMAERVTDLCDVRDRVLAELRGEPEPGIPDVDVPSVLFADDLAPADTATLDTALIHAVVTRKGGATSHTAIIARQLDLPCIVAAGHAVDAVAPGVPVLVDGGDGTVTTGVDPEVAVQKVEESR
ncbi:phosphoenolpyruvate-utilizing N-terminal domain-containing protein, partial [Corynebacterium bovis]